MQAKPLFPTVSQVRELSTDLTMVIPPEWEDINGHVNVQYYLTLYQRGGWVTLEKLGFDEKYIADNKASIFDLENHIRYLTEINVGDTVSVHSRVLSHNKKLFQGMFFIVNDTHNRLASTIEYLSLHIDLQQRRSVSFSQSAVAKLTKLHAQHQALSWQTPVSGLMDL